jgi:hypothetical protein
MKPRIANVHLKIVALALALLTWFAVRGRTIVQSSDLRCPVSVTCPEDVKIEGVASLTIDMRVQGPAEKVVRFRPDKETLGIDARAEIAQALAGGQASATVFVPIERRDFRLPRRIELVEWPHSIRLYVQRLERDVPLPVKVTWAGNPPPGYRVVEDRIEAKPTMVRLDLGAEEAARIKAVETTPVNVEGRTDAVHDLVWLVDPRSESRTRLDTADDAPGQVEVVVPIEPIIDDKDLSPVPVLVLRQPGETRRITVEPTSVTVTVSGRADLLASLGPEAVTAYLELKDKLDPGAPYTLPVTVVARQAGITVVKAPVVKVTVE